jgi:hypothetical protein
VTCRADPAGDIKGGVSLNDCARGSPRSGPVCLTFPPFQIVDQWLLWLIPSARLSVQLRLGTRCSYLGVRSGSIDVLAISFIAMQRALQKEATCYVVT